MNTSENEWKAQVAEMTLVADSSEPPLGKTPEIYEVWNWMHGEVTDERREEIESHIARDPDVFAMWSELRMELGAEQPVSEVSTSKASNEQRLQPFSHMVDKIRELFNPIHLGGFAVAAIALGLVTNLVYKNDAVPPELWSEWQIPKSTNAELLSDSEAGDVEAILVAIEKEVLALGYKVGLPGALIRPVKSRGCESGDANCTIRRNELMKLGTALAQAVDSCKADGLVSAEISGQAEQRLIVLRQYPLAERWLGPLKQWTENTDAAGKCLSVRQLTQRVFTASNSIDQ